VPSTPSSVTAYSTTPIRISAKYDGVVVVVVVVVVLFG
jgi:hypothetical protein